MDDKIATNGNGNKKLRDSYAIKCDACGRVIGHGEPYRIVGIRAGADAKALAVNVYRHRECEGEGRA